MKQTGICHVIGFVLLLLFVVASIWYVIGVIHCY